jgi:hypothetical protein
LENQRRCLDAIGESIGVQGGDLSPWYNISFSEILEWAGKGLQRHYTNMYSMLSAVYLEYPWKPWRFAKTPSAIVHSDNFIESLLKEVEKSLKMQSMEDWYRVSREQLSKMSFAHVLFGPRGNLFEILKRHRPDFPWDESKFFSTSKLKRNLNSKTTSKQ